MKKILIIEDNPEVRKNTSEILELSGYDVIDAENGKAGVKMAKKYYETEASGNVNLKSVKKIAATGVDRISIGSITHSVPAVDFKLEI